MNRLLVTGSRRWTDRECIRDVLRKYIAQVGPSVMLNGACPSGADILCAQIGERLGFTIERYPAQWHVHGKSAGFVRNLQMIRDGQPTHCVAFIVQESKGATHCAEAAIAAGIPTKIFRGIA